MGLALNDVSQKLLPVNTTPDTPAISLYNPSQAPAVTVTAQNAPSNVPNNVSVMNAPQSGPTGVFMTPQQMAMGPMPSPYGGIGDDFRRAFNTLEIPATGLIGTGLAAWDQLFNGGHDAQNYLRATNSIMDQLQPDSAVSKGAYNATENPLQFGSDFTQTGIHYAPYFVNGTGGVVDKLGPVAQQVVGGTLGNIAGFGLKTAANAGIAAPTFAAINAVQQAIDPNQKQFDPGQAMETGGQAALMTAAGDTAMAGTGALYRGGVQLANNAIDHFQNLPRTQDGFIQVPNSGVNDNATVPEFTPPEQPGDPRLAMPENQVKPVEQQGTVPTVKPVEPVQPEPTTPTVIPKTGNEELDTAIQRMSDHYAMQNDYKDASASTIADFVKSTIQAGNFAANRIALALKKAFSKEEDQAIYDALQGVKNPNLTPEAARAAKALKALYAQAHDVRLEHNPNIGKVMTYAPRILREGIANAVQAAHQAGGKFKDFMNGLNPTQFELGASQPRQVGKFVDENGNTVIGKPKDLGLTVHEDGTITNGRKGKNQVTYTAVPTNTHEIQNATGLKYLDKSSHVSGIYHAATAALQAKDMALKELNAHPEQHGLLTMSQVQAAGLKKVSEVRVNGLKDSERNNYFAAKGVAKRLNSDDLFKMNDDRGIPGKLLDKAGSVVTQLIVMNPAFHGANQLVQSLIAAGNMREYGGGWVKLAKNLATISDDDVYEYLSAGGHIPSYGNEEKGLLSRMTFGASKISSKMMYKIELGLRVSLYKSSREMGMAPGDAVKNIDQFLGDQHSMSRAAQRTLLFSHYLKTMGGALYAHVRHPLQNSGATVNALAVAGILYGINYEWQQFTQNKDAYARLPGELGLVKDLVTAPGEVANGQIPSILLNHINPIPKELAQQVFNYDLFTKKPVSETGRFQHAFDTLVAPTTQVGQLTSGKRSPAELVANELGFYTPHAKGYSATGNAQIAPILNQKIDGKAPLPGNGEDAQKAYFDALNKVNSAAQTLADNGDTRTADELKTFLDRNHDKTTGQSITLSPRDSIDNAGALFSNDTLRHLVEQFEQSQPSHDPIWNLSDDKIKALMQYRAQYTGDAAKTFYHDQATAPNGSNWIDQIDQQEQAYYNNLPKIPGAKPPINNNPKYPQFDPATTALMDQYNNGDQATKTALMQSNAGELSKAFAQIAAYTNAMRRAEGAPEKNDYPTPSPQVQQIINTYNALPQHDGKKGGNASRYAWIQNHQDEYTQMQNYLASTSMSSLIDQASKAQFKGTTPSQQLLKDIANVGKYDIASQKNTDGTTTYSLNPAAAYQQSTGTSSSGYSSSYKKSSGNLRIRPSSLFNKKVNSYSTLKTSNAFAPKIKHAGSVHLRKAAGMNAPKGGLPSVAKPKVGVATKVPTVKLKV